MFRKIAQGKIFSPLRRLRIIKFSFFPKGDDLTDWRVAHLEGVPHVSIRLFAENGLAVQKSG